MRCPSATRAMSTPSSARTTSHCGVAYGRQLDYDLEIGFFVGRAGRNLSVDEAGRAIFGVSIFNEFSARDIQRKEMTLKIGPSKGKDFCTAMGPYLTTIDKIDEWLPGDRPRSRGYPQLHRIRAGRSHPPLRPEV